MKKCCQNLATLSSPGETAGGGGGGEKSNEIIGICPVGSYCHSGRNLIRKLILTYLKGSIISVQFWIIFRVSTNREIGGLA